MLYIKNKAACALAYVKQGLMLVLCLGKVFRPGSHGIKDATNDPGIIEELYNDDEDLNPFLATGTTSGLVALELHRQTDKHGNPVVDGITELKLLLESIGIDPKMFIYGNLKAMASNTKFVLLFRSDQLKLFSKMAIRPGINFHGEYGCIPLPPSSYKVGTKMMVWEWDGLNAEDMEVELADLINSLTLIPEWLVMLLKEDTPFDAARRGFVSLTGEDAMPELHNHLCQLRAFDVEHAAFMDYAIRAAALSEPEIPESMATECAWYVWLNYRPLHSLREVASGKQALEDALEY